MSILKVSIRQVKAARSLLAWSQETLAGKSGISLPTIKRLEADDGELGGRAETGEAIRAALEKAGIQFIEENGGGPGVRLKKAAARAPAVELVGEPVMRGVDACCDLAVDGKPMQLIVSMEALDDSPAKGKTTLEKFKSFRERIVSVVARKLRAGDAKDDVIKIVSPELDLS